jgi:hypothetical protein
MTSKQPKPTVAELEILQVLWEGGPRSVREIHRVMNEVKPTGYTGWLATVCAILRTLIISNGRPATILLSPKFPRLGRVTPDQG